MSEFLKNKQGVVQLDLRQRPLKVGQPVLVMDTVYSKGGRGSVSTGWVAGFDRYVIVVRNEHDAKAIGDWLANKPKSSKPKWHQMREAGLSDISKDSVSSCYLIGVSPGFLTGWEDGSLFE